MSRSERILRIQSSWAGLNGTFTKFTTQAMIRNLDSELMVGRSHHGVRCGAVPQSITICYFRRMDDTVARSPDYASILDEKHWFRVRTGLLKTLLEDGVSHIDVQFNDHLTLRLELAFVYR